MNQIFLFVESSSTLEKKRRQEREKISKSEEESGQLVLNTAHTTNIKRKHDDRKCVRSNVSIEDSSLCFISRIALCVKIRCIEREKKKCQREKNKTMKIIYHVWMTRKDQE